MQTKTWHFEQEDLDLRLAKAEGQLQSIRKRLKTEHNPKGMLQQLSAARNAIDLVGRLAILEYIKSELKGSEDPVSTLDEYSVLVKKYGW